MKRRILVLEDERTLWDSLLRTLSEANHEAVWSRTAHEGLRRSLHEPFDMVLLDLNLSDMGAWTTLDWLSKLHPMLPVVLLTDRPNQARRAAAHGAGACLEKPLNGERLRLTVEQVLADSPPAPAARP